MYECCEGLPNLVNCLGVGTCGNLHPPDSRCVRSNNYRFLEHCTIASQKRLLKLHHCYSESRIFGIPVK